MRKIFILSLLLALSSCSSAKKVPIVYPTLPKQPQENNLQTENTFSQDTEKVIDLSEENVIVVSDSSLKQENKNLKSQLQKKDLELERLKQKIQTNNNQVNNFQTISSTQKKQSPKKNNKQPTKAISNKTSLENLAKDKTPKGVDIQTSLKTQENLSVPTSIKEQQNLNLQPEKNKNLEIPQSIDSKTTESTVKSEPIKSDTVKSIEIIEPVEEIKSENITTNKSLQKKYYLRLISIRNHEIYEESMKNIVKFLKTEDIIAKYYSLGKYWVVDVIETPEYGTAQAEQFRQRIRTLKYQGQLQFKDAYYTVAKY